MDEEEVTRAACPRQGLESLDHLAASNCCGSCLTARNSQQQQCYSCRSIARPSSNELVQGGKCCEIKTQLEAPEVDHGHAQATAMVPALAASPSSFSRDLQNVEVTVPLK